MADDRWIIGDASGWTPSCHGPMRLVRDEEWACVTCGSSAKVYRHWRWLGFSSPESMRSSQVRATQMAALPGILEEAARFREKKRTGQGGLFDA